MIPTDQRNEELARLLARTALHDQQAFARLYQSTSAHLYAVALRILKRPSWAEDVLQESFINVWHHAETYAREKSQPLTWLTSIVRNRALDWVRRKEPSTEDIDGEKEIVVSDERPNPLELLVAAAEARTVRRCLEELDGMQQQSLALAFYHGLTHAELASHMKQPLGTIKSWVRRGLQRLRQCLERISSGGTTKP